MSTGYSRYLIGKRPKRDQTLVSKAAVRRLGKGKSGGKQRLADQFLKENPQLKKIFNKHSERRALATELFERGGGKRASKMYDRFGYTEGDLVETLKGMREKGMISRREMIRAARNTFKSKGAYKRKSLRELYALDPSSKADQGDAATTSEQAEDASVRKAGRIAESRSTTSRSNSHANHHTLEKPDPASSHAARQADDTNKRSGARHKGFAADRFLEKSRTRQQLALDALKQRREEEKSDSRSEFAGDSLGTMVGEKRDMKEREEQESYLKAEERREDTRERHHEDRKWRAEEKQVHEDDAKSKDSESDENQKDKNKKSAGEHSNDPKGRRRGSIYTDIFSYRNKSVRDFGTYTRPSKDTFAAKNRKSANSNTGPLTSGYTDARRFLPGTPKRNLSTGLVPPTPDTNIHSLASRTSGVSSGDIHRKAA